MRFRVPSQSIRGTSDTCERTLSITWRREPGECLVSGASIYLKPSWSSALSEFWNAAPLYFYFFFAGVASAGCGRLYFTYITSSCRTPYEPSVRSSSIGAPNRGVG